MIKQCDQCNGTKRIKGLGMIEKECAACKGIGWIEVDIKSAKNINGADVEVKIKRGRKKRVDSDG